MSIIKHVTLQTIVAHDFRYDLRILCFSILRRVVQKHRFLFGFMIIHCSDILRTRNVSDKVCRENHYACFIFISLFPKNRIVCEIMWKM